jgi:hypothetical protein
MNASIPQQIARLQAMTVGELRVEWERLYGEPTRSRNRVFLWRRLAWRVQELQFGGLTDVAKRRLGELAEEPFRRARMPNGFSTGVVMAPPRPSSTRRDPRLPSTGSTLVRKYRGDEIRVVVLEDGFEWSGRRFDSLSEVALAVTGSKWNGWLFFGLTKRTRKP